MSATLIADALVEAPPRATGWRWLLRQLVRQRQAQIGGSVLLLIVICALIGPYISPYDPLKVDALNRLLPPSGAHWFGTDELGRDMFSRILFGTRYFALICLVSVSIAAGFGVLLGLIAGAGSYWGDMAIMRAMDVVLAFPFILLILAVVAILGPEFVDGDDRCRHCRDSKLCQAGAR